MTRPEKLYAISPSITRAFWDATHRLNADDSLGCMIVTAQGRYFTAGIDLPASAGQRTRHADATTTRPRWHHHKAYRAHHLPYAACDHQEKRRLHAAPRTCLGAGRAIPRYKT